MLLFGRKIGKVSSTSLFPLSLSELDSEVVAENISCISWSVPLEVGLLLCEMGLFGGISESSQLMSIKSKFAFCDSSMTVVACSKSAGRRGVADRLGWALSV